MIGQSVARVDALDKVTGRAKYTQDLCPKDAYVAKVLHATIAHGWVKSVDTSKAEQLPGVIRVATCLEAPDFQFPTAGHVWSTEKAHQDIADRKLLNRHVRYYGDDVAAVVAVDEVTAARALRLIDVEYEEYPAYISTDSALAGTVSLHEEFPGNILKTTSYQNGDYEAACSIPGLRLFEDSFETPMIQHCHLESVTSFAYTENGRMVVVAATQIPHICRRVVGQALGIPWGDVRIVKPTLGGGFGNRQDVLYEPLNAWLCQLVGGRPVRLELSREEVFFSTRIRHAIRFTIHTHVREDGRFMARRIWAVANNGAYASHGHAIAANAVTVFRQLYQDELATWGEATTVFTNNPTAGAMRGYGVPQIITALESHVDNISAAMEIDPLELRRLNMMKQGYLDANGTTASYNGLSDCLTKGAQFIKWDTKRSTYKGQTGNLRRGVGAAIFNYKTGVYPISLETGSARMTLNQDGSIQLQIGATEIGQGMDTVACQMAAQTVGVPVSHIHLTSTTDTDLSPFDTGAYASRQSYVAGTAVKKTASLLKERILDRVRELYGTKGTLDIVEGDILQDGEVLMSLSALAMESQYSLKNATHVTAEMSHDCKTNAFAFGACFAEVEVDMALGKIKVIEIANVHDSGTILNHQLAEGQVHGGMSMGLGFGLSEQLLIDPKTGRLLNDNLLDYKLPTSMDTPELHAFFVEQPEETGPYGNKALGEPPACPVAAAVRNAVFHATGIPFSQAPITPQRFFQEVSHRV